jgi:integrase/recombinase XerC
MEKIDADTLREWVVYQMDQLRYKPATVNLNLSALRTFFQYLLRMGYVKSNPCAKVSGPKQPKPFPRSFGRMTWTRCSTS